MISNNEELAQALEAMGYMYRALVSLRKDIQPVNSRNFALLAEGPIDEIRKLEEQIHEYSGLTAAEVHGSDAWLRVVGPPQDWPEVPGPAPPGRRLGVIGCASGGPGEALSGPPRRRVILDALGPLLPPPGGDIERLEVSGKSAPRGRTISLTRASHRRINQAIDALAAGPIENGEAPALSTIRPELERDSVNSWRS